MGVPSYRASGLQLQEVPSREDPSHMEAYHTDTSAMRAIGVHAIWKADHGCVVSDNAGKCHTIGGHMMLHNVACNGCREGVGVWLQVWL